jgi:hypothetical protein
VLARDAIYFWPVLEDFSPVTSRGAQQARIAGSFVFPRKSLLAGQGSIKIALARSDKPCGLRNLCRL